MDEAKRDYIRQWLKKAEKDIRSARRLASSPDPILETAFFHCQQAGEKSVKAYLAFCDHPLEKRLDLGKLVGLAKSYEPGFAAWQRAAELLTPLATTFRYSDDWQRPQPEPDAEQYSAAEQAAVGLFDFVYSLLPEEARPTRY
jgi:HEPN domain-containing protein